jgi:hypothetical protein
MAVDTTRLRLGDLIAAGSAFLLFIFMFFKWYGVEDETGDEQIPDALSDLFSFSAWEAFGFLDLLLLLIIIAVIAIVVVRVVGAQLPPLPVPLGTIMLGLAALAVLIILFRLIFTPNPEISFLGQTANAEDNDGQVTRSIGVFLGLLAALGMLAGAFLSAQERGEMTPGVGGPATAGGPLGGGQPYGGGQPGGGQPYGGGQPAGGQPVGGQPGGATAVGTPTADPGAGAGGATQVGGAGGGAAAGGAPKADWYPDPEGKARLRYWDGTQWTDQTAD